MTPLDAALAEIEARVNAATEGPWRVDNVGVYRQPVVSTEAAMGPERPYFRIAYFGTSGNRDISGHHFDDASFIASARTDVPRLVAALRYAVWKVDAQARLLGSVGVQTMESTPFDARILAILTGKEAG